MAFETTKNKVEADIQDNGNNEITAEVLRDCLNDDIIEDLGSAIDDKANLEGGNNFTGNQTIDGIITVKDSNDSVAGDTYLKNFGLECGRASSYIRPISNDNKSLYLGGAESGVQDWSSVRVFASNLDISGDVGIGVEDPSEKLEVNGNVLVEGNIYERFNVTAPVSTSQTLSDSQRVIQYIPTNDGTLTIPTGLQNKVWEIFATGGGKLTVQNDTGVTLVTVHNGNASNNEIQDLHSAKLIQNAINNYVLIKY